MTRALVRWAIGVIAVLVAIEVVGLLGAKLEWPTVWRIVIFVPVLALANAIVGGLLRVLTLPLNCLTFGLFGFVVNASIFWVAGIVTGARMNLWGALIGSACMTLISAPLNAVFDRRRD